MPGIPLYKDRRVVAQLVEDDTLDTDALVVGALAERIAVEALSAPDRRSLLHDVELALAHLNEAVRVLDGKGLCRCGHPEGEHINCPSLPRSCGHYRCRCQALVIPR